MTRYDGPPMSWYDPPDDDPPCPDCDAPLHVSGQEAECEECGYVDEPDYEAISDRIARADAREDDL